VIGIPLFPPSTACPGTVLVVDDERTIVRLLERLLTTEGYVVLTAQDGDEALDIVRTKRPDVLLMDVRMPRRGGFDTCRHLKGDADTRLIPVVLMTGAAAREDRIQAIEAGADDFLTKPIDAQELKARVRSLMRLKRHTDDLDSAEAVILSLALTVEARDPYTDGHCHRLAAYGVVLGRRLQLGDDDLTALHRGGYLHDLGKIAIPDAILLKSGPLTPEETTTMRQHPVIGDRLCGNLRALHRVRPIVRHHHERLDGSGYPDHLSGDAVPLLAQIISIVDLYDAVTTARTYRPARGSEVACQMLIDEANRGWRRADLVDLFVATAREGQLTPAKEAQAALVDSPLRAFDGIASSHLPPATGTRGRSRN
jgi:putative two-component system response regulator